MRSHAIYVSFVLCNVLAACGGGSSGGTVGGTAPPAAVTPVPPTPPVPSYPRFAELTGDQTYRTACAAFEFGGVPPAPRVASAFGTGLGVAFAAGTSTYTITGDGLTPRSFGPADIDPAAPTGSIRYVKTVSGNTERFSIPTPTVAGAPLEYTRAVTLSAFQARLLQYLCVTGVPTRVGDTPAGSNIPFARVAFNGTAYRFEGGVQRVYSLATSPATFAANLTTGTVAVTIDLIGIEQTAGGPVGGTVPIGTITATLDIDTSQPTYYGLLNRASGTTLISGTMGGWFFGPQGAETGAAMSAVVDEPTRRTTITGNLVGFQR